MKYVLTLLAICLSFHFASRVEAGEPLILEGEYLTEFAEKQIKSGHPWQCTGPW